MIIDNEKVFQTEDLNEVQEIYENNIKHFSKHTYGNRYLKKLFDKIWGQDYGLETFCSIYGDDWKQFKEDYKFELEEYLNNK